MILFWILFTSSLNTDKLVDCRLSQIAGFESIANAQRVRINQTRDICGDNLNHRAPLLEMFRGRPEYMGFADDAVEEDEEEVEAETETEVEAEAETEIGLSLIHI